MSDSEIVKIAKAEVERLKAKLASNPDYQKLLAAQQIIGLYGWDDLAAAPAVQAPQHIGGAPVQVKSMALRDPSIQTKTAQIERVSVSFLKEIGRRATSGELLTAVKRAGVDIGGKEPNKALSAYLSGFKTLNNVREHGGYGLLEWGDGPGPNQKEIFG
ncbi:hypothetical protein BJ123_1402 [Rhodopseudomonas thermotolerans]|uniref:Uncharacterized protein n=2 Tax=Rhodopseudomonas TaxID=1073 RepID=A0A336JYU9_9BRAD|nr:MULTISPECIES: hypothetical protein [Rhodopseudomonas]RED22761.1 hypothetical protein BJ125_1402 [Rhodopseudomonas pentothenatexigens]REF88728.1 hypothetical protein BJ123_1402 [Rhodopseudomonas thermotolerans]SSW93479.1 hypothetical protein SAMN05892882_1402 [Rhodopseudomonas pentothenatexigens]